MRRRDWEIFVLWMAEGMVVKRAVKGADGGWQLVSDHPAWEPVAFPENAAVFGRAVWMAGALCKGDPGEFPSRATGRQALREPSFTSAQEATRCCLIGVRMSVSASLTVMRATRAFRADPSRLRFHGASARCRA